MWQIDSMTLLALSLSFAFASDPASDVPLPRPADIDRFVGGRLDLGVGFGLWQAPTRWAGKLGDIGWPRANGHLTGAFRVAGPLVVGLHGAAWSLRGAGSGWRVEPRVGFGVSHGDRLRFDLTAGLALDASPHVDAGPVLAQTARWWVDRDRRTFVALELRVAPLVTSGRRYIECVASPCEAGLHVRNPGGTGALVGIGRSLF